MNGSLQKKKNSKNWYIVLVVKDENGKSKRKWESTGTSNHNIAKKILRQRLNELDFGISLDSKKMGFNQLFEEYQNTLRFKKLAYNTRSRYKSIIRTSLSPYFSQYKVENVTPALIQKYIDMLEVKESKSPYTIKHHFSLLKSILEYARKKLRIIQYNPCIDVDLPTRPKRKPSIWTAEQCSSFLALIKDKPYYMPILFLVTTGARVGEVCALQIADYNKENGYINISKSMSRDNTIKSTKTSNVREFKLPSSVKNELDSYLLNRKKLQLLYPSSSSDFLFINSRFNHFHPNSLRINFQQIRKKSNLPYIRLHDLRHSFITLMLESGEIDIKTVSEMVGHAKITTTQQIYQHVTNHMKQDLADNIESVFDLSNNI
jgi:integrase